MMPRIPDALLNGKFTPLPFKETPWRSATQDPQGPPGGHWTPRLMAPASQQQSQGTGWTARNFA